MADWKDIKGLGPWNFVKQSNKWGYLNNPRWSSQQDAIDFCAKHELPLDPAEHKPCGHWHSYSATVPVYKECSLIPILDWPEFASSESFINYSNGKIFILQRVYNDGKVYVYLLNGNPVTNFSTIGTSPACKNCLGVDTNLCYVGASANVIGPIKYAHIATFSHSGTPVTHWKVGSGTYGHNVAGVHSDGTNVYVASGYGLHKYTTTGTLIWEFPYRGTGVGEFWTSYGLYSDGTHVFVVDYSYNKILKYLCSDGSFVMEESGDVPSSSSAIIVDDNYVYIPAGWGVCVFYKNDLKRICCPVFDGSAYNLDNVLGGLAYDGMCWWGLDGNLDKVVKFNICVAGEPMIGVPKISEKSDEPQVWPMPE